MCKFSFLYGSVQIYIFVHHCTNKKAPQTPNICPAAPAGFGQLGRRPKQYLKMEPRQGPEGAPLSDKKLVSWKRNSRLPRQGKYAPSNDGKTPKGFPSIAMNI
jgi:hypothetical protein